MGLERLALAFEKDVETQKGTGLLISRPWTVSAAGTPSPPPASSQLLTREVEEGSGLPSCLAGQGCVFSSSHVLMWELDYKES